MNPEWLNHRSKKLFCDHIRRLYPFDSLCEVGCNAGANLVLLAQEYPSSNFVGVDINKQSVDFGNAYFREKGRSNVQLVCERAEALHSLRDKSFDIAVTNALLCLMDRDNIEAAARELIRITKKSIVLFELNYADRYEGKGVFRDGYWVRDYVKLFQSLGCFDVHLSRMPDDVWEAAVWKMYGAVVTIHL